jgi:hypothetical protein
MKKVAFIVIFSALCIITAASAEEKAGDGACLSCHGKDTPLVIKSWSESAHAKNDIGCGECHEGDYDIGHMTGEDRGIVEAYVCARCHADVSKGHFSGKHGISFRAGRACTRNMNKTPEIHAGCNDCHEKGSRLPRQEVECARFLAQSPEMQRQGCLSWRLSARGFLPSRPKCSARAACHAIRSKTAAMPATPHMIQTWRLSGTRRSAQRAIWDLTIPSMKCGRLHGTE